MNIQPNAYVNSLMVIMLAVVLLLWGKSLFAYSGKAKKSFIITWLVITVFSVFFMPENGDTHRTYDVYENYIISGVEHHLEPLYFWLMDILPHNYFIFRFVIWGLSSLFVVLTCKKLNIERNFSTCVFICVCLIPCFYYLRNSLGISMLFYVMARILKIKKISDKNIIKEVTVDVLVIVASYFTHTSMPLYIILSVVALLIPMNSVFLVSMTVLMVFIASFGTQIGYFMLSSSLFSMEAVELGEGYLSATDESFNANLNGQLWRLFWLGPYALLLLYGTISVYKEKNDTKSALKSYLVFSDMLFFGALLLSGFISWSLYYRIQNTSFFSIAFFIMLFLEDKRNKRWSKLFWIFVLLYTVIYYNRFIVF